MKVQIFVSMALSCMFIFHSYRNNFLQRIIKCGSSKVTQSVDKRKDIYILVTKTQYQETSKVQLFQRNKKKPTKQNKTLNDT